MNSMSHVTDMFFNTPNIFVFLKSDSESGTYEPVIISASLPEMSQHVKEVSVEYLTELKYVKLEVWKYGSKVYGSLPKLLNNGSFFGDAEDLRVILLNFVTKKVEEFEASNDGPVMSNMKMFK